MTNKQYKLVRMPLIAYINFLAKKKKMEVILKKLKGKRIPIPLTQVLILSSKQNLWVHDNALLSRKRKK